MVKQPSLILLSTFFTTPQGRHKTHVPLPRPRSSPSFLISWYCCWRDQGSPGVRSPQRVVTAAAQAHTASPHHCATDTGSVSEQCGIAAAVITARLCVPREQTLGRGRPGLLGRPSVEGNRWPRLAYRRREWLGVPELQ